MDKKIKICAIAVILAVILSYVAFEIAESYAEIKRLETILDEQNIGVIFRREQEQDLQALRQKYFGLEIVLFILIVFLLLSSCALLIPQSEQRKMPKTAMLLRLCVLLFVVLFAATNNALAVEVTYRPRAEIPLSFDSKTVEEASCSMIVRSETRLSGFVAYMVAIGNVQSREFLEVGYCDTATGLWLYSSQEIAGVYDYIEFSKPQVGESYSFQVIKIGNRGFASINGGTLRSVTWTQTEGTFLYIIQGETLNPYNKMCGVFRNLQIGYWKLDDTGINDDPAGWIYVKSNWFTAYTTVTDIAPYDISMISGSPYYTGADVTGGYEVPTGGHDHPESFRIGGGESPKAH